MATVFWQLNSATTFSNVSETSQRTYRIFLLFLFGLTRPSPLLWVGLVLKPDKNGKHIFLQKVNQTKSQDKFGNRVAEKTLQDFVAAEKQLLQKSCKI